MKGLTHFIYNILGSPLTAIVKLIPGLSDISAFFNLLCMFDSNVAEICETPSSCWGDPTVDVSWGDTLDVTDAVCGNLEGAVEDWIAVTAGEQTALVVDDEDDPIRLRSIIWDRLLTSVNTKWYQKK